MAQSAALALTVSVAVATTRASDWHPVGLLAILGIGTVISGDFPIEVRNVKTAGSSIGIVLATGLLGPAPAALIAVLAMLAQAVRVRPPVQTIVSNVMTFTMFPLAGGFLVRAAAALGLMHGGFGMPATVFVTFLVANLLNFLIVEIDLMVTAGRSLRRDFRDVYVPVVPVEIASAVLTATLAAVYDQVGMGFAALLGVVGVVFQYLLHTTFVARRRGEQLEKRGHELATLQFGLLTTVIKTLNLRDQMTARHSAAVARYAREIARAIGMSEEDQDFVHTAALLHDIGKFVFPDAILFADRRLTDADFEIVRSHPQAGAELVASIEGYGPVADVVLAHHERIDGTGYPFGLSGDDIPIAARIIAVADTYDVMTARDSYRQPVTSAAAIAELRRVAGAQLDGAVVEAFVGLVESTNLVFRHSDAADFERELSFDQRIRDYAAPRVAA